MMAPSVASSIMVGAGSAVAAAFVVRQTDSSVMLMTAGLGTALYIAGLMVIVSVADIMACVCNCVVLMDSGGITVFHGAKGIAGGG